MDVIVAFGIVGAVASVVGVLLAAPGWKSKLLHVVYGLAISVLSIVLISYQAQISELHQIEAQAKAIVATADFSTTGSQRGFLLSSLAFLEKHRSRFPDTYSRAVALCEKAGVIDSRKESPLDRLYEQWRLEDAALAMKALLAGVAAGR